MLALRLMLGTVRRFRDLVGGTPITNGLLLEDNTSFILLEDNVCVLLLE